MARCSAGCAAADAELGATVLAIAAPSAGCQCSGGIVVDERCSARATISAASRARGSIAAVCAGGAPCAVGGSAATCPAAAAELTAAADAALPANDVDSRGDAIRDGVASRSTGASDRGAVPALAAGSSVNLAGAGCGRVAAVAAPPATAALTAGATRTPVRGCCGGSAADICVAAVASSTA